jgi:uncharacterized membrane protein YqhA
MISVLFLKWLSRIVLIPVFLGISYHQVIYFFGGGAKSDTWFSIIINAFFYLAFSAAILFAFKATKNID